MRLTLLCYDFGESVIPLASALAKRETVQLVAPRREVEPFLEYLDPTVRLDIFDKPRLRQPLRQLRSVQRVLKAVRDFRPDAINLQQGHFWFNPALRLLGDVPLVVTVHDPQAHLGDRGARRTPQWLMDVAFRRADRIITHAEANSRALERRLSIPAERMTVVPLAFSDRRCSCLEGKEGPPVVLFFGRIWPYKGLNHLIQAEPEITRRVPGTKIVIAGQGEAFSSYRRAMIHPESFEIHDRYISLDDREAFFDRASVVVLPYVEATQTGIVPLAYRHGTPVVATDVGGLPEVVFDGKTGHVVPSGDVSALTDAIVRILDDRQHRRRSGQSARRVFEELFDTDAIAARTHVVLEAAVADRRCRPLHAPCRRTARATSATTHAASDVSRPPRLGS